MTASATENHLWTVGHSNHAAEHFTGLLAQHEITAVADVRSTPYSFWSIHFNQGHLKASLTQKGIAYTYLGEELGGRPPESGMYDSDGHVLYGEVARTPRFQRGLERLATGMARFRVAIMCSEEDPTQCHRRLLVARAILEHEPSTAALHIRGDGRAAAEPTAAAGLSSAGEQLECFPEQPVWRSAKPVRQPVAVTS